MNKSELTELIAKKVEISKAEVDRSLNLVLDTISEALE